MIACGIDPSLSGTGIVFYDTETKRVYAAHLKQSIKPGFAPLVRTANTVEAYLKKYKPKIVGIEEPFVFKGRIQGAMRVFYYHALIRKICHDLNIHVFEYPPTSWKKKFSGSGHSSKGQVLWTARSRYGRIFYSHDLGDAFGILISALSDFEKQKT